ncbi:MAG: NAD(P)-dependent glycerol-3-phosphate dehydrogenase [Bryobacteraceae bacterium]|nr:NAD(P)-dependent glycerol-3-phosphate dehydrogenase [Bryobacteraceae bacterium]MDW8378245.1 NAD(P)H-dependent glycerol-3-phosphate dehydrogenase [Bryobacterales bacterium]
MKSPNRLSIVGGGSWGTALALALSCRYDSIGLWVHAADLAQYMKCRRENPVYLPGFSLPPNIEPTPELAEALEGSELVLTVVPSHHCRAVAEAMKPWLDVSRITVVSATKGLEINTLKRMSEVLQEVLQSTRLGSLSGPSFARDVARGEPVALAAAAVDPSLAQHIQLALSTQTLRIYTNSDPVGVELGGALKNVIAIAAGLCQGLGLGASALAALVTRGLAEMTRLAVALGAQPSTLSGLAGLGDLVLTCTGDLSRNRQVGIELARGRSVAEIVAGMRMVAEGVQTTRAALQLARQCGVEMPITEQVGAIIQGERSPQEALRQLMDRSLKEE